MEVGDDVVVHRNVLLDDRGGIMLGNKVSISDFANIYSHTHSIVDQRDVTDAQTQLEDGVRMTYHATILAGVHVGCDAMVGAMAVATRDVRPHHVYVGIPAKSVRVKPTAPRRTTACPRLASGATRREPSGRASLHEVAWRLAAMLALVGRLRAIAPRRSKRFEITIRQKSIELAVRDTVTLHAVVIVTPSEEALMTVQWSSDNADVATSTRRAW